jgi:hypothetical protein
MTVRSNQTITPVLYLALWKKPILFAPLEGQAYSTDISEGKVAWIVAEQELGKDRCDSILALELGKSPSIRRIQKVPTRIGNMSSS